MTSALGSLRCSESRTKPATSPSFLPPLLRTLANVIVVDNGSTDGTPEIAARVAEEMGAADRLDVLSYPFQVSRCGPEHLQTPADSVHSLTYFYNWAFSHVGTTYSLKWDGDMLLTEEGEQAFTDLAWQLEGMSRRVYMMRIPLYVESSTKAYADASMRAFETWGWPNRQGFQFGKGFEWEVIEFPTDLSPHRLPDGVCFEIKWLDVDEFSNWSHRAFDSGRVTRKQREWLVFNRLQKEGGPDGVFTIESSGEHVIEAVRRLTVPDWDRLRQTA